MIACGSLHSFLISFFFFVVCSEFMKNFALNGIFCGPGGKLVVTDADLIELSNLKRQVRLSPLPDI